MLNASPIYVGDKPVYFKQAGTLNRSMSRAAGPGHACCCGQSVAGLSARTQWMYLTLYVSRYLDLLDHQQAPYLVVHKLPRQTVHSIHTDSVLVVVLIFYIQAENLQVTGSGCLLQRNLGPESMRSFESSFPWKACSCN